jgi:hypothetical protein
MKSNLSWQEKLKTVLEKTDGSFGHNIDINIRAYIKKLEKFNATVEIVDYYTIKIDLPFQRTCRNKVLLHILTHSSMPTECRYNVNKDQLTVEWHY